jgi:hypothetical protein
MASDEGNPNARQRSPRAGRGKNNLEKIAFKNVGWQWVFPEHALQRCRHRKNDGITFTNRFYSERLKMLV